MACFFCIFHALSFELNCFRPEVPFNSADVTLLVLHTLSLCTADVTLLLLHTLSPDTAHSLLILQVCPFWYLTPSPRRCDSLGTSYFLLSPSTPSLCTADVTLLLLHTLSPDTAHSLLILQVCPFWYLTPSPRRCDSLGTSYFLLSPSTPSLCTADVTLWY